jgi:formylglycine-generating enzyme required for sulfatase activity
MINNDNQITLMDFGVAKRLENQSFMTSMGKFLGNYAYAAPEQFYPKKFGKVTNKTDIYSFGILGFQLLTGFLPFEISSHGDAMGAHCYEKFPNLSEDVPTEICTIIQKCTQKYQNDRYQTIQELQADIEKLQLDGDENLLGLEAEEPATRELAPLPAETTKHNIDLILVEGGTFTMGKDGTDNDEKPEHDVTLDSFYIGKYPVTNEQYAKFLNEYGSDTVKEGEHKGKLMIEEYKWGVKKENGIWKPQKGYENHPIVRVTWYGANEFCKFYGYRLPTEAEWEYAARGGNKTKGYKYSGSSNLDEVAWYGSNSDGKTHPVNDNKKKPNELGIYHMSGNVYEWCEDWYDKNYYQYCKENNIKNNPVNTDNNSGRRVLRGGSWNVNSNGVRAASRSYYSPKLRSYNRGFRVVLVSPVRAR